MFFPFRDENRTKILPVVTLTLIAVNVIVFLYQYFMGPLGFEIYVKAYGFVPLRLFYAEPSPLITLDPQSQIGELCNLFTSMFMHAGFLHIIMNMWILWIFGDNVEEALGKTKFVIFYLLCGVVAALTHGIVHSNSDIPMVGASGAISGVMGAYMILFPRTKIVSLFVFIIIIKIVRIPALVWIGFWFVLQVLYFPSGGEVAYLAHIGGFLAGIGLVFILGTRKSGFRVISVK